MPDSKVPDQIPLFDDDAGTGPVPSPQPWRPTRADTWSAEESPPAAAMEQASLDLLRRNLEFLRAMALHAGKVAAAELRRFRKRHEELVGHLVRWRINGDEGSAGAAVAAVSELADLRLRALEQLDPACLRKVMAAEPRVRVRDLEIERALSAAEFEIAEARGELVAIEIPALPSSFGSSELLGPDMVENLVRVRMHGMKAEQEGRPLPPREGLSTLLRDLPVEWLDATWKALGLGSDRPRHRKERGRIIARHLIAEGTLPEVVGECLSEQERRLLAFLLERGGKAPAAAVTRVFGNDDDDGWFWSEEPPTSVLGRVRIHGLVFVGATRTAHATRTVLVPRELRQGLEHALALAGADIREEGHRGEGHRKDMTAPHLRPELVEALNAAFPAGIVEAVWHGFDLEAVEDGLRSKLAGLEGASLLYRRTLEGDETWDPPEGFDLEDPAKGDEDEWRREEWGGEDELGGYDPGRSYALFFLSPRGEGLQFEIQGDFMDEAGHVHPTKGVGRVGWVVAVSGLAPFALLRVTSLDAEERFGLSSPDIQSRYVDAAGMPMGEDEAFLDMLGPEGTALLDDLRRGIARALESLGITTLPEEELRQPVSWLVADETTLVGPEEETPLTVEDALFFHHFG